MCFLPGDRFLSRQRLVHASSMLDVESRRTPGDRKMMVFSWPVAGGAALDGAWEAAGVGGASVTSSTPASPAPSIKDRYRRTAVAKPGLRGPGLTRNLYY